jgi:hypothetical protein
MSNILSRVLEWPAEYPDRKQNRDHARAKVINTLSSKSGPTGPNGPAVESEAPGGSTEAIDQPCMSPDPFVSTVPPEAVAVSTISKRGKLNHQVDWHWAPERPVVIDALQYSVRPISQGDRDLANQICSDWQRPEASTSSADEVESVLGRILACRVLDLDPTGQPFTVRSNTWGIDLIFQEAKIYVVANPSKTGSVAVHTYSARTWDFMMVLVIRNERARAAGYLSGAEVISMGKKHTGGWQPRTVRISYDALKPWEWLAYEVAAQIQCRQSADHDLRSDF